MLAVLHRKLNLRRKKKDCVHIVAAHADKKLSAFSQVGKWKGNQIYETAAWTELQSSQEETQASFICQRRSQKRLWWQKCEEPGGSQGPTETPSASAVCADLPLPQSHLHLYHQLPSSCFWTSHVELQQYLCTQMHYSPFRRVSSLSGFLKGSQQHKSSFTHRDVRRRKRLSHWAFRCITGFLWMSE